MSPPGVCAPVCWGELPDIGGQVGQVGQSLTAQGFCNRLRLDRSGEVGQALVPDPPQGRSRAVICGPVLALPPQPHTTIRLLNAPAREGRGQTSTVRLPSEIRNGPAAGEAHRDMRRSAPA